nr:hypothetical protein [Candidatus Omnitrophota bacterium]
MAYASKKNFAKGTLAGAIDDDDLAFSLQSNEGLLFPDTGSGNYFWGVFWGTSHSSPFKDTSREIVKCYRDANDDFVITARGEEGTTPKAWDSGDNFMLSLTAGTIEEIESGTLSLDQTTPQTIINGQPIWDTLTASKVVFTDVSKKLTSTGIGTSAQFIKGDGSLDGSIYLTTETDPIVGAINGIVKANGAGVISAAI